MEHPESLSLLSLTVALKKMPEYGFGGKKGTLLLRATGIICLVGTVLALALGAGGSLAVQACAEEVSSRHCRDVCVEFAYK